MGYHACIYVTQYSMLHFNVNLFLMPFTLSLCLSKAHLDTARQVCYSTPIKSLQRRSVSLGADVARDKLRLPMSRWEKWFAEDEIRCGPNVDAWVKELIYVELELTNLFQMFEHFESTQRLFIKSKIKKSCEKFLSDKSLFVF